MLELRRVGARVGHGRLRRLLHHVAELPGQPQAALAAHARAPRRSRMSPPTGRPREARGDADLVMLQAARRAKCFAGPEHLLDAMRR